MGQTRFIVTRMLQDLEITLMRSMNIPSTVSMSTSMEMAILHTGAREMVRYDTEKSGIC
jgi:hypothetical protein